jgi:hypothetical protein
VLFVCDDTHGNWNGKNCDLSPEKSRQYPVAEQVGELSSQMQFDGSPSEALSRDNPASVVGVTSREPL